MPGAIQQSRAVRFAKGALLIFLLVLPCLVGSLSSVVPVLCALLLIPAVAGPGAWRMIAVQPAMLAFLTCFAALTLVFALTAREPADLSFALNFLALPLAAVVYLLAREAAGARTAIVICALCLIGAALGAAISLFSVAALGLDRGQGLFGGPNVFARMAVVLGFVALGGALIAPGRRRALFYLGPAFALAAALLSGSRGAALAIPPLLLVGAAFLLSERRTRLHVIAMAVIGAVLVALLPVLAPSAWARLMSAATVISEVVGGGRSADWATQERIEYFEAGIAAFRASPLVGYGWAHLGTAAALADPVHLGHEAGTRFMFHNDALNFAVAGGAVGIAVWIALLLAPIAGAVAMRTEGGIALRLYYALVLTVSYAIFGLTDMVLGYDLPTTLYAFLTALVLGGMRTGSTSSASDPASRP